MQFKFFSRSRKRGTSIRKKLVLGLSSIAVILLLSSVISVLEYRRMSNYVSDLIASNINSINLSHRLVAKCDEYNTRILALVGSTDAASLLEFDQKKYIDECDSIRESFNALNSDAADSVIYSYTAYMLASLETVKVVSSDFIDSRDWYFNRLQPIYNRFRNYIDDLNDVIYNDLETNSMTFQQGYYRSIMPGVVSVGAGLVLVLLLLFFIISYYVNPLAKMLSNLENYRQFGRRYSYRFEGDDELVSLNEDISDIVEENMELKRRINNLRDKSAQ